MHRLAGAALLLAAAGALLPPPAAAQQLPAGPLKLPGPSSAASATAAAAAEQGQLGWFDKPAQPASPGDEPLGVAGGRRSVQAAAAATPGEPPHLPASRLSKQRSQTGSGVGPLSRRLDETRQQVAGPLTLPGPGQRFSGAAQLTNQLVTAGGSPTAEGSTGTGGQEGAVQGSNTQRLLAAAPLPEALPQPPEAASPAAPTAEQPASPFAAILPTAAVPVAEAATAVEQPPAAEALAAAAPEQETPFEPLFPSVPPTELSVAPAAEGLPAEAVPEPVTAAVPGPGSEATLLEQAELALSGPTGPATTPAFPPAAGSTGISAGTAGTAGMAAQLEPGQPPAGTPGSNFSSLISLLDPPAAFQMPPLSPQQQENLPKLQQLRQGIGTVSVWRDVGNFGGTQMACGMGFLSGAGACGARGGWGCRACSGLLGQYPLLQLCGAASSSSSSSSIGMSQHHRE